MRAIVAALILIASAAVIYTLLPSEHVPASLRAPAPAPPPPKPGSTLLIDLAHPVEQYGAPADPSPHTGIAEALGMTPHDALAHAAAGLAEQYAWHNSLLPGDALQFLLDGAGAVVWSVRQTVLVTRNPGADNVATALRSQLDADGPGWHGGVGIAPLNDDHDDPNPAYVVAVLSARPAVFLAPIERAPPADQPIYVRGTLAAGYGDLHGLALDPNGRFVDLKPSPLSGGRFEIIWTPTAGRWQLELLAEGPHGPTPLGQLTFDVGGSVPSAFEGHWPSDPTGQGADALAELVAADRAAHGLQPLQRDPELDAIAEAHTLDMQANGFLGHVSPTTGRPADRVRAADYRAAITAENVAFNRSLTDAEAGLMRSLGHRRNLLSPEVTHLGLAAIHSENGWYLTQLFARPRPVIADTSAAADQLIARLSGQLKRTIRRDRALDRLARAEARRAEPKPDHVLNTVADVGVSGRVTAWVATLALLEQFDPPQAVHDERFARVGIGVYQTQRATGPDIQVVMLLAE
jgi:uncharacterized protein YkwD/cell division septation protein DedD